MNRPSQVLKLNLWFKNSQRTKAQDQMVSQANSINHLQKSWHLSFSKSSEKLQRKEYFQSHSMRPPSLWYQNQRYHKKGKLYTNITHEHRCKNPQQNISKQNLTTHYKDHTPRSSGIYSTRSSFELMGWSNYCPIVYLNFFLSWSPRKMNHSLTWVMVAVPPSTLN